ncbi:MAG: amidase family protein, partial [Acidobacteriota bacterium]|nr:amidase family protein [Acidobacteriota bacterium]
MTRFDWLPLALLSLLLSCSGSVDPDPPHVQGVRVDVVEGTIPDIQRAMQEGRVTARELIEAHLLRIALYEERINAAIAVNADALATADRLDRERAEGRVRGPLHGIAVALKDNIQTTDMATT